MKAINEIKGVDIYLLDQLMKGNIHSDHKILDAGCGSGRNLSWFFNNQMDIIGIDPNEECILRLQQAFPNQSDQLFVSSIEDYNNESKFDVIICNAVLHFAKDHDHFDHMFQQLDRNLKPGGLLFIRMTSDIGLNPIEKNDTGVYELPDKSTRYLITKSRIKTLLHDYSYTLIEPVKTVNVDDLRFMTTLVFRK